MTETTIPTPPSKRPFRTAERALKVMPNGDVMHGLHRVARMVNEPKICSLERFIEGKEFYKTLFEQALPMLDLLECLIEDENDLAANTAARRILKALGRDV